MYKSKLTKVIVSLLRRILGVTRSGAKRLMRAMLRTLAAMARRSRLPVAGFVLPTVTMVLLVVILLTVAIVLRSFDRANTARNVRVNQQVLAAATPALDRAKAKIEFMLREDPQRPTSTPSDAEMYRIMSFYDTTNDFYKFGDEQRLVLRFPVNNGSSLVNATDPQGPLINTGGQENEAINTAWRYPVDTNSDGLFDTFTLYGIFFRSPALDNIGSFRRARRPLDARTPPMSLGGLANANCIQGIDTVASLVGDSGWYRVDGKLQKSFFVYTANVPITETEANNLGQGFQAFTGTRSISALEYQQDQSRIPLSNNAVVYEDDLDISPGPALNLNGRIFTNSNLLVGGVRDPQSIITLYQVSSRNSCFYDQENSKVVVGGNAVNSSVSNLTPQPVTVHLFRSTSDPAQPNTGAPLMDRDNDSVGADTALDVLYDSDAYTRRLDALVAGQLLAAPTTAGDPVSVQRAQLPPLNQSRNDALETYFKERLRKVPFRESLALTNPGGVDPTQPANIYVEGNGDTLRPADALRWSLPTDGNATEGEAGGPTRLTLALNQPPANNPDNVRPADNEPALGNRFQIGNNLPALRWDGSKFLGLNAKQNVGDPSITWADGGRRFRTPEVTKLADVGTTDRGNGWGEAPDPRSPFRDGFWERTAAQIPTSPLDGTGGLRVITSAGVYDRTNSFLPPPKWIDAATGAWKSGPASVTVPPPAANTYDDPTTLGVTEQFPVVWPDSMPMSPLGPGSTVWNNGSTAVDGIAPGTWGNWATTWSPAVPPPALPDATALPVPEASPNFVDETLNPANRRFAKGDLRMRATAVYHSENDGFDPIATGAAQPNQTPLACVSSYYDPSNASTARNITGLADVSGEGALAPDANRRVPTRGAQQAVIGSNNGITYGPPKARPVGASNPDPATGLLSGGDPILDAQANLVFPDGRFANGPLRSALRVADDQRTLAQKAAIDSTNCALQILDGTINANPALIPDGAIQEVAFLNAKEIKAIERDNPNTIVNESFTLSRPLADPAQTTNYNLPLEEREPLEIRATQLDINALRGQSIGAGEWLLPNSGIIYASRDDALPDRSDRTLDTTTGAIDAARSKRISPNDYQLDPTRKPNGIVLINGNSLFRGGGNAPTAVTSVVDVVREKGLTLVSNLPAYIKGTFNPHGQIAPGATAFTEIEEFNEVVDPTDWSNFYERGQADPVNRDLNRSFACRQGDPRLPQCQGDYWRPANVLADAVTLLSQNFRFGFRNEGDFDLRNNAGAAAVLPRRQQGFFNNNFVTNGLSSGAFLTADGNLATPADVAGNRSLTDATYVTPNPPLVSSYFNNFVTPVQRRGNFPEYVMEVCTKLPVSECTDADWFVDLTPGANRTALEAGANYVPPDPANPSFQAGSTVDPPIPALQRFPRRVAFQRDASNQLSPGPTNPQPLGIGVGGVAGAIGPGIGASRANSLWFAVGAGPNVAFDNSATPYQLNTDTNAAGMIDGGQVPLPTVAVQSTPFATLATTPITTPTTMYAYSGSQPLLAPVQQLINPAPAPTNVQDTGWVPRAVNTTFNLIVAAGDTPSRTLTGATATTNDFNGGLQNLPRFLELWSSDGTGGFSLSTNMRGSFIQQNRSAFSTAPYRPIHVGGYPVNTVDRLATLFSRSSAPTTAPTPISTTNFATTYNIQGGGRIPYFTPPTRNWGYDVGLLSQPPDLFTQKFTTPSTKTQPAEYFREVPRNDEWVNTLMCGVVADDEQSNAGQPATELRANCPPT